MSLLPNQLELLSPAKDITIAKAAILHGADAVYLGGPQFGARHAAGNSLQDIAELTIFAHRFGVKVMIALNTILHNNELEPARQLIYQLYDAGVDALIVQDMGLLALDLPPIELHASTQTDIRTLEKAKFLADVGFSQLVLARELELAEIQAIHAARPDTALEFFIHGALCVAFSGQCYISHAESGRSANRGDCSQACRMPYTLKDQGGRVIAYDKHLLSMKDNNQSMNLPALVEAGIRSFKIEGRYKDVAYVKNITAHYRQLLDQLLEQRTDLTRASHGRVVHHFVPNPDKTFNRGQTDYFVNERKADIGAFDSPKYLGLPIGEVLRVTSTYLEVEAYEPLANGDGLNVLFKREVIGFGVNRAEKIGENRYFLYPHEMPSALLQLPKNHPLNRNHDHIWSQLLTKPSADRELGIQLTFSQEAGQYRIQITTEAHHSVSLFFEGAFEAARDADKARQQLTQSLSKLGGTPFYLSKIVVQLDSVPFIPTSLINQWRREALEALETSIQANHPRSQRKAEVEPKAHYPNEHLTYLDNVYNDKAREFYQQHGVTLLASAFEAHEERGEVAVMITKHCLRYSYDLCPKQAKGVIGVQGQVRPEPMMLTYNTESYRLEFNCRTCEMHVMGKIKPKVLKRSLVGA